MDNCNYNEVVERLFDEQNEEVRNKKFGLDLLKPLPGAQKLLLANRGCGKTTLLRDFHERLMRDGQIGLDFINTDDGVRILSLAGLVLDDTYETLRYAAEPCFYIEELKITTNRFSRFLEGSWKMPPPSGKKAWEPAKWQGGTDHEAPLKHGKDPKAVAKRRKKKKLTTKR